MTNRAIVVVDMLYDFIDGTLACNGALEAVVCVRQLLENSDAPKLFILDHHPVNHSSFKDFGGIWPVHCVADTRGGEIHDDLKPYVSEELSFYKGTVVSKEQYSGFEGVNSKGESLGEALGRLGVTEVTVVGIATEYCVKETVLDLINAGFGVSVVPEGLAYVDHVGHLATLEEFAQKRIKLAHL